MALWLVVACSDDSDGNELTSAATSSGAGGGDDRFHAQPNGVHTSETAACDTLRTAVEGRVLALGCVKTLRPCPSFLTATYQPECMEYDEGSVQGCVDYFNGINVCDDLDESQCVLTSYPGTQPAGCP